MVKLLNEGKDTNEGKCVIMITKNGQSDPIIIAEPQNRD